MMPQIVIPAEAGIQCADGFLVKPGMTGDTPQHAAGWSWTGRLFTPSGLPALKPRGKILFLVEIQNALDVIAGFPDGRNAFMLHHPGRAAVVCCQGVRQVAVEFIEQVCEIGSAPVDVLFNVKWVNDPIFSINRRGQLHKTFRASRADRRMVPPGLNENDRSDKFRIQGMLQRGFIDRPIICRFRPCQRGRRLSFLSFPITGTEGAGFILVGIR